LRLDTATAGCGAGNAAACVAQYGKEAASVAAVATVVNGALDRPKLDQGTRDAIERALVECAEFARSQVLLRHAADFENGRPTATECNQPAKNPRRKGLNWAMQLGIEMHEEARECAEERLGKVVPGRFSLEQRYRYDSDTKQKKPVSAEDEKALEESGNGGELAGSLKPDVVIHMGDLLAIQAIYDFKFRCENDRDPPSWTQYQSGQSYHGKSQGEMYEQAFGEIPIAMITPRWGVIR
jgi:hypothetical protein